MAFLNGEGLGVQRRLEKLSVPRCAELPCRKEVREYHFKLNLIKESFSMVIGKQSVKLMQYAIMRLMT